MTDFRVVIPARFASQRLPGKPLLPIGSQILLLLQPVLGHIGPISGWFDDSTVAEIAILFENPANVDRLLVCLEHRSIE